ncbi:MAG: DUF547 domain-containing protein [Colwellia sp.]|nr:DUF547 domain-containing protein [Colwellia sp.]
MKIIKLCALTALIFCSISNAEDSHLPEAFQGDTWNSKYEILYDDLTQLLQVSVVDTGLSNKKKLKSSRANIGTRMKSNRKAHTALEANRFYFEAYRDDQSKERLTKIRKSLEYVSQELPLSSLTEKEQLAYWLNLYNVTVLEQLTKIYPIKLLEDEITDDDSFFNEKLLTISGHNISLNYIHHEILLKKFGKNKDVIYGLYQGNIGSPNIRKQAYTAKKVIKQLESNAEEFINSNRGVFKGKKNKLRVSRFYEQSKSLFPNFKEDLRKQLLYYANGAIRYAIEDASSIRTNIEDWTITDVYGTSRKYGGGANNNAAAMLGSVSSGGASLGLGEGAGGGFAAANMGLISESYSNKTLLFGRFSPEQIELIRKLNDKQLKQKGTVTVTDIENTDGT